MTFINQIIKTVATYDLIRTGDTIIIGVSGGPDSIALLEALDLLKVSRGLKIIACHVNHGLRKSADIDEHFVKKICRQKNIICETIRININRESKESLEQAAREERFKALIKIAKKYHADSIALGHHQDDLAETVLMRIVRGSGLQGLQAILPERIIHQHRFIRPLLETSRESILDFLSQKKLPFRQDPTNKNIKFFRNKIRHHLIPELKKEYNPQITQTLSGLAETSALDYEFLNNEADKCFKTALISATKENIKLSLDQLKNLHPSMRRMIFRKALSLLRKDAFSISLLHIHQIETLFDPSSTQKKVDLTRNLKALIVNQTTLQFKRIP